MLWGRLPCETDAAVLTIAAGESVTIDTVSHEGVLEDQGKDPLAYFGGHGVPAASVLEDAVAIAAALSRDPELDGPHVVTGPIHVEGALPGDLLKITVERLQPRVPYGVISNRHGKGALAGLLPRAVTTVSVFTPVEERASGLGRRASGDGRRSAGRRVPARARSSARWGSPSPATPARTPCRRASTAATSTSTCWSRARCSTCRCRWPGALAYVGDPHFAQGDGEVALTALEASLRATLRFDVVPRAEALAEFGEIVGPLVRTPEYLVPDGPGPRPERGDAPVRARRAVAHPGAVGAR